MVINMFKEKLSFLMAITNTTNADLARAISIAPSCISRWRTGKRLPPKQESHISSLVNYFYKKITTNKLEYKLSNIEFFSSSKDFKVTLEKWLIDKNIVFEMNEVVHSQTNSLYYYGDVGKRQAVIKFLNSISTKSNQTLLLFSDESINWMLDENFSNTWSKLLIKTLKNGNKIKIIHTIAREYNEIFESISKWLPLYLTGMIEPYYYPKIRDGVLKRTIFVCGNEAVISNSIDNNTNDMLNIYINDKMAVDSLKKEFNNYLSLCIPLADITTKSKKEKINELCSLDNANVVINSYSLSFVSAPKDIIFKALTDTNNDYLISPLLQRKEVLLNNLKDYTILDIINVTDIFNEKIPYSFVVGAYYTKDDYIKHLENIISMLKEYKNYNVVLKYDMLDSFSIYIKENTELMIEKNDTNTLLISREKNMVNAFWDHHLIYKKEARNKVIDKLHDIIRQLK